MKRKNKLSRMSRFILNELDLAQRKLDMEDMSSHFRDAYQKYRLLLVNMVELFDLRNTKEADEIRFSELIRDIVLRINEEKYDAARRSLLELYNDDHPEFKLIFKRRKVPK